MNFEIAGKLLERTVSLASKLQCDAANILSEIYRKGLEVMEGIKPAHAKRLPRAEIASFIEENWSIMSDDEMAQELGLSFFTVRQYRCNMGLKKTERASNGSLHLEVAKELTEEEKAEILSKPEHSHETLSQNLHKPISMIKRYRLDLAEKHILEQAGGETDIISARKFGLKAMDYQRLRIKLGFLRLRGGAGPGKKMEPCELGTVDEIRYALTEGGQTISGIIRTKELPITRERARQIIKEYGLDGNPYQRKPLWYSHQLVGLEKTELARNLTDKDWVTKQLAESGGLPALAAKLAVTEQRLKAYLHKRLELETGLEKSHGELVELKCSFCQSSIWRPKRLVERDKINHPNKTTNFCNKICQGKWLGSLRRAGSQAPKEMVTLTCSICGNKFEREKNLIKVGQKDFYCSQKCRYQNLPRGRPLKK